MEPAESTAGKRKVELCFSMLEIIDLNFEKSTLHSAINVKYKDIYVFMGNDVMDFALS